jgi:recombination protein RecT
MTQVSTISSLKGMFNREDVAKRLQQILGKRASTFTTSVLQIVQSNELLKNADPDTILNSAMVAATLDLPLNNSLGFAYIVPYNTRQKDGAYKTVAQFQLGYKGFIQLAQRSGQFKSIDAKPVYEGQLVNDNSFGGISFNWQGKTSDVVVGYAAYFQLLNGFEKVLYMSAAELQTHGTKYSQTFKKGFGLWKDDFHAMAIKTVIKLLLSKYAPLSVDMQKAIVTDQAIVNDMSGDEVVYVDVDEVKVDTDLVFAKEMISKAKSLQACEDIKKKLDAKILEQVIDELNAKRETFVKD